MTGSLKQASLNDLTNRIVCETFDGESDFLLESSYQCYLSLIIIIIIIIIIYKCFDRIKYRHLNTVINLLPLQFVSTMPTYNLKDKITYRIDKKN